MKGTGESEKQVEEELVPEQNRTEEAPEQPVVSQTERPSAADPIASKPAGALGKVKAKKKWEFPQLPKADEPPMAVSEPPVKAESEEKPGAAAGEKKVFNFNKMTIETGKVQPPKQEEKKGELEIKTSEPDPTDPFAKFDHYDPLAKYKAKQPAATEQGKPIVEGGKVETAKKEEKLPEQKPTRQTSVEPEIIQIRPQKVEPDKGKRVIQEIADAVPIQELLDMKPQPAIPAGKQQQEEKKEGIDILAFLDVKKDGKETAAGGEKKAEHGEAKKEAKKEKRPQQNALAELDELEMV